MILAWASPFNVRDTLKQVPKFRELQVPNFQVPGTSSSEIPKSVKKYIKTIFAKIVFVCKTVWYPTLILSAVD